MFNLVNTLLQPSPTPLPPGTHSVGGWRIAVGVLAIAVTLVIVTKIVNKVFGGGSGGTDTRGGW